MSTRRKVRIQSCGMHPTGANKRYDFSAMSQRRLRRDEGVLLFGADPKRGRADDGVFQGVHILRSSFCA